MGTNVMQRCGKQISVASFGFRSEANSVGRRKILFVREAASNGVALHMGHD